MLFFRNIIHVGIHSGENADCDQCCDYLAFFAEQRSSPFYEENHSHEDQT